MENEKFEFDPNRDRIDQDTDFICRPERWPAYPLLPLKKVNGNFGDDDFCGYIIDGEPLTIVFGNIFGPDGSPLAGTKKIYESLDLLLSEYMVD